LANQGVSWKFITERASHRGRHWERVCRQLKEPLRKVLGKALLSYTVKGILQKVLPLKEMNALLIFTTMYEPQLMFKEK